ncbi:OVOS2, partial [Cervus elaphus hippelaphus]
MQSHSTEQACLHLLNLNESVSLSVVLEYDGSNSTIFDQTVEEDNFYACVNFEVSHKSSEQMAFVTLLVKGDTLKIFERRSVALSSEETVTFVQTDKPIYKSGENVKLRIVTLDTKFLPINDVYPLITLQDPQDNRIFQWQNVTSSQNITELSFQLILEPVFGDYSIVVKEKSGKTLTHQFTVNRNVLPKFEVKVSAPQTITISDDEFQVSTCAKYTFGQPVHGKVHIQVCREFFSSGACEKDKNEICEQFVAQLKNGCVSQIINTKVFQLYRSGLFMSFYITTTLKFSGPNNVPMVNKLLQLELNDRLVGNYTTDENGEAQFSIDTSDIFDPEFRLKATYVRPQSCYLPSWLIPQYMDGHFSVQRFYSQTSSFLLIEPEPKELRCYQEKIVTVHYSLNSEAYRDDSNINFFYLASPDSVCALRAVDKSVLLKSEQQLSAETGEVTRENFDSIERVIIETVRTNFPETWIWELVSIDSSGSANLSFTIPDTITQWEANGFCVNGEAGFGISSTASLEASQLFFVEITSPSSVVRNERSDLIVSVFSYLNTCVEIFTQLEASQDFEADISTPKDNSSEIIQAAEKKTYVWTVTPKKLGTKVSRQVDLNLTNDVVEGSTRAFFTVVGGEQNIALLASDTYILDYLKSTKQLTEEIKSKALFFLSNEESGRKHMTFAGMKKYVFIDELVQRETLIWLASKQKIDGCFKSDGKLFNNAWEVGDEEDIVLTAYIVAAFLEAGLNFTFPALRNGLFCLEEALANGIRNGYNLAILAYVFALAGKEEQKLETEASPLFILRAPSAEMEKTCYVLLAVISQKNPDLTYASKIVQWLAQQMNSHGGFSSPQDTPICLLAITRYMNLIFSDDQVTVSLSSEEFNEIFQVNSDNHLLVQRSELTKAGGQYTVDVEGQGCAFIQVIELCEEDGYLPIKKADYLSSYATLRYTVLLPKKESGFSLSLQIVKKNSSDASQSNFDLTLENNGQVMKSEFKNDHVLFYLENVSGTAKSFTFSVEQINHVANIQPAPVMVYDYYEKGSEIQTKIFEENVTGQDFFKHISFELNISF